eukprot:COSAG02_NODE_2925_length_7733_cov_8.735918_5_plen_149_part_00
MANSHARASSMVCGDCAPPSGGARYRQQKGAAHAAVADRTHSIRTWKWHDHNFWCVHKQMGMVASQMTSASRLRAVELRQYVAPGSSLDSALRLHELVGSRQLEANTATFHQIGEGLRDADAVLAIAIFKVGKFPDPVRIVKSFARYR